MNKKRLCIKRLLAACFLAGAVLLETDSFAGQMGGFDVEVGDGSYIWNEGQWGGDYSQQWNNEYGDYQQWSNTGESMQQDWNGSGDNTQQNWGDTGDGIQQEWGDTGDGIQQEWHGTGGSVQQNWDIWEENTRQNWNSAGENNQQNWSIGDGYTQRNWNNAGENTMQNRNNAAGNIQNNGVDPAGNMNQNGNQEYLGNASTQTANPTDAHAPKDSITHVPTLTPKPIPKPTITPKPSKTPKASETQKHSSLVSQAADLNSMKSQFFEHFLFKQSTFQNAQHLPDEPVYFSHQEQTQEEDCPLITLCSEGSVQILSFRINDREVSWHWEENSIIADTPIGKGEYQIELLVLTQGGKTAYMEPWKFSA